MKNIVLVIAGTLFMAAAVNFVYEPVNLVTGGFSGLGILVKDWSVRRLDMEIPVWMTNAVLNIPLFLAAWKTKGKAFIKRTLCATVSFTVALSVLPVTPVVQKDYFLAVITGGILNGIGLGLVFRTGASTGGTDLCGTLLNHRFSNVKISRFILAIDSVIVLLGAVSIGMNSALYAILSVSVAGRVMDFILEGGQGAKTLLVISEKYELLAEKIMQEIGRGVTMLDGQGMYTQKARPMMMCVVGKKQIGPVSDLIRSYDKNAFFVVMDVKEVRGNGFEG